MMNFKYKSQLPGILRGILLAPAFALTLNAAEAPKPVWTYEAVIRHAMTNNPDARIASQRVAAARAGLDQANAAVWPTLQLKSSYLRTDNPMLVFGSILNQRSYDYSNPINFNDVPDADNLNVKGLVTMPLYQGGRIKAGREAARAGTETARYNSEAVRQTLAFEAARAFHTVLKTRRFVEATLATVQSFETNLALARSRLNAGTLLRADVLDVEVRLARAREDLVRARNAQALAERALRNLLGLETGPFAVADAVPEITAPESHDSSGRSELAAARFQERAAEAETRKARSGWQPRVNAFGSVDYDYGFKFNGDGASYTAGLMLEWDLWDGQLTRARVNEARANLESAREMERKVRLAVDFQVEQARLNLKDASERLAVTGKVVAQAQESVELTRSRFGQGLALSTQLIDAEAALTGARVRRAEAEADQRIAVAALRRALGLSQLPETSNAQ